VDAGRFDDLLRSLFESPTRRGIGRTLAGLTLGGMLGKSALADVEARKKKRRKKCKGGKKKCGKKCRDLQSDPLNCGSCGNRCDDDMVCRDGECVCPEGETECGDTCCPSGQICADGQCADDPCPPEFICPLAQACVNGACVCPAGETACENACCEAGLTCVNGACEDLCPPQLLCLFGQGCVDGECACPLAACDAADDPTNDQFEGCSCGESIEGEQFCFAIGSCASPPPTCATSAECGDGFACQASSCGDIARCGQLCDLS
jgi:hypothetical protein